MSAALLSCRWACRLSEHRNPMYNYTVLSEEAAEWDQVVEASFPGPHSTEATDGR
jgi:hypothetical protein